MDAKRHTQENRSGIGRAILDALPADSDHAPNHGSALAQRIRTAAVAAVRMHQAAQLADDRSLRSLEEVSS